ncbi:hypothetical protein GOV14_04065 [Candidatus Pacearchaeota archaeon]|nr:hypothetical protein [Candidatus Pacearchaeota archaeon]
MKILKNIMDFLSKQKYWIIISLIYLSLIYSTSISYSYGPENTIDTSFIKHPLGGSEERNLFKEYYPDFGKYPEAPSLQKTDFWKLGVYGDAGYYLKQSEDFSLSFPPYKYRVLPPFIASVINEITGLHLAYSFVLMNIIFVYLIGIVFTYFCKRCFNFSDSLSLIGGILAITSAGVTKTLPFPMMEPAQYFFFLLALLSLRLKNDRLYILSAILGVLSKELLVFVGILYFANHYSEIKNGPKSLAKVLLLSIIPIIVFMVVRLSLGGPMADVAYSVNLFAGEFPPYGLRLFSIPELLGWLIIFILTFSFIWMGLLNLKQDRFIYLNTAISLPLILIATFFLSGQVTRQIGTLYPLIIISFLFFFNNDQGHET